MTDIRIRDQGTLVGFEPVSEEAIDWINDNVFSEPWQWLGPTLWVEHRLAEELAIVLVAQGLDVELQR